MLLSKFSQTCEANAKQKFTLCNTKIITQKLDGEMFADFGRAAGCETATTRYHH